MPAKQTEKDRFLHSGIYRSSAERGATPPVSIPASSQESLGSSRASLLSLSLPPCTRLDAEYVQLVGELFLSLERLEGGKTKGYTTSEPDPVEAQREGQGEDSASRKRERVLRKTKSRGGGAHCRRISLIPTDVRAEKKRTPRRHSEKRTCSNESYFQPEKTRKRKEIPIPSHFPCCKRANPSDKQTDRYPQSKRDRCIDASVYRQLCQNVSGESGHTGVDTQESQVELCTAIATPGKLRGQELSRAVCSMDRRQTGTTDLHCVEKNR